jgi:hypothetical protein
VKSRWLPFAPDTGYHGGGAAAVPETSTIGAIRGARVQLTSNFISYINVRAARLAWEAHAGATGLGASSCSNTGSAMDTSRQKPYIYQFSKHRRALCSGRRWGA